MPGEVALLNIVQGNNSSKNILNEFVSTVLIPSPVVKTNSNMLRDASKAQQTIRLTRFIKSMFVSSVPKCTVTKVHL